MRDHISDIGEKADLEESIKQSFGKADDYLYARELRNAIVHRGLDPAAAAHADNNLLFILCPPNVQDRGGRKNYSCTFKYTVQLAECCNRLVNTAILEFVDSHGFLEPGKFTFTKEDTLEAVKTTTAMPDWAKAMAAVAFEQLDFTAMALKIAETRVRHLKELLGQSYS